MRGSSSGRGKVRRNVGLFFVVATVASLAAAPAGTLASDIKGQFPYYGVLWMSRRMDYSGLIYVTSNRCNSYETGAWSRIKNSTTGTSEMWQWRNGIDMRQYRCDGAWDYSADIQLKYMDQSYFLQPSGYYIGGRNVDLQPGSGYCSFWGTWSPCGVRPQVQINVDK